MSNGAERKPSTQKALDIVRDAGGRIVGRTRLQKIAYLLELAGLGDGFPFEYRHYGPYSEELAMATRNAALLGVLIEEEYQTTWGGFYSIYRSEVPGAAAVSPRQRLIRVAAAADPVELELAATAAFLKAEGVDDPWGTTEKLKPAKAQGGNLDRAKTLYRQLQRVETPRPLPEIL